MSGAILFFPQVSSEKCSSTAHFTEKENLNYQAEELINLSTQRFGFSCPAWPLRHATVWEDWVLYDLNKKMHSAEHGYTNNCVLKHVLMCRYYLEWCHIKNTLKRRRVAKWLHVLRCELSKKWPFFKLLPSQTCLFLDLVRCLLLNRTAKTFILSLALLLCFNLLEWWHVQLVFQSDLTAIWSYGGWRDLWGVFLQLWQRSSAVRQPQEM